MPYVSYRYGHPVEACGTLLNPEAPGSYKFIYRRLERPFSPSHVPRLRIRAALRGDVAIGRGHFALSEPIGGRRTIWRMGSFNKILLQLLESGPTEVMTLIERALKVKRMARAPESLAGDLFRLALREEKGLTIAEYPSYALKRSIPRHFTPDGMYAKWTLKALQQRGGRMQLPDLVKTFPAVGKTEAQYLWVYLHIQREVSRFVAQFGALKIDLKKRAPVDVRARGKQESDSAMSTGINDNIHEAHLEALIAENLDSVEGGLKLVGRQYNAPPVGRIDLICRDRRGAWVVIEIKKFRASAESIIDQVTRYMGWVREHLASRRDSVRGIIIVGVVDDRLSYSVKAVPNLEVKCFSLSLRTPE